MVNQALHENFEQHKLHYNKGITYVFLNDNKTFLIFVFHCTTKFEDTKVESPSLIRTKNTVVNKGHPYK